MDGEEKTLTEGRPERITPDGEERGGHTRALRWVLWAVGAAVVAGLAIALWGFTADGDAGAPGASGAPGAVDATTAPTPRPTRGPLPGAEPTTGSEVQAPDATAPSADRLPALSTPSPLVSAPLPDSGSASGELVDGFPTGVMAPAPPSEVLQSSIATEGDTMQVTLQARTDATPDEVSQHYRAVWSGLGLAATGSSDGADTSYSDALSSLTLAFTSSGTGTVYTVYGVFRLS
ncbi:hypothetical protein [Microbacterium cremeum]|uniref:hypothetical protein n=1 Tax=Microbacterium cremeum TaxID=2782169 RepID=UPI00188840D5|nr:hypothetical protein [Microbacterium cremeum]